MEWEKEVERELKRKIKKKSLREGQKMRVEIATISEITYIISTK